jgi:hypothetical protein
MIYPPLPPPNAEGAGDHINPVHQTMVLSGVPDRRPVKLVSWENGAGRDERATKQTLFKCNPRELMVIWPIYAMRACNLPDPGMIARKSAKSPTTGSLRR